ncbi:metallopeptidase TldD-related protein [Antrihabitans cavernicola]|uniref:TldD/PmbA family protein n=1 Tax=Antrihabitans cavernicola TaxID=2495913 RepID=A0A5A7S739_9NOCA|nr:metallopeptidase TldD-related protein [Spelaeibacter cavernicola]KAA0021314.1 TldD/PmbA family protein [Spelaeibacter cavernicola]
MIAAQEVVERALALAKVDDSIVIVTDTSEASVRWAGNSMTTNGIATSRTWTVIAIVRSGTEARVGSVTSTSVAADDIAGVVAAAEAAARSAEPSDDAMPLVAGDAVPTSWGDGPTATSIDVFAGVAADLATGFDGADRLYGFADHHIDTVWLGTSSGLRRRHVQPTGSLEINGKRDTASAWAGSATKDFADVRVPDLLSELSRRLDWAGRRIDLPAGRYETLLPPSTVADLMIYLLWTMEGRGAEEGRTALSAAGGTRVGEKLTDLPLTLFSDPAATGLEYTPFVVTGSSGESISLFDNGLAADRVEWVRDGTINALAYPRSAAAEFGTSVAVPGDNLLLTGGSDATVDDMVAGTERGLLLTTLWYIREVDPTTLLLTGLTRDGVYLVEDGEVRGAVNNFRFNESPLDLLRRVSEVGATVPTLPREWKDYFTRTAMPPLRIPDFHMSSVSQAT